MLHFTSKCNNDQDNTNGTGTVDQTGPETTTLSKIRRGVCHYHFHKFSDRGSPLLLYNSCPYQGGGSF